jgi:hypothetical protein
MFSRSIVQWVYRRDSNYTWASPLRVSEDLVFRDEKGKVRMIIEKDGSLTVTAGYAWNGCSPKIAIFDLLVGTPDGAVYEPTGRPKTYYASMVHDALYQFLESGATITRAQADDCFLRLMTESEFVLRRPYWLVVRAIGSFVWEGKRRVRKWRGRATTLQSFMG